MKRRIDWHAVALRLLDAYIVLLLVGIAVAFVARLVELYGAKCTERYRAI